MRLESAQADRARRRCVCGAAVGVVLAIASGAAAQSTQQLLEMSFEELAKIEIATVFGASERAQPVTEAPSSVTIVTADEFRRYGYRTLADILRSVQGLYVTDDRNYSFLGIRGFAAAGDYNTRILLLINGQRLNDSVYDQAAIGGELGLDPQIFDRVEIVRGPASSLYGTSAFFAVVNLITRAGGSLNGGSVAFEAGNLGSSRTRVTVGNRFANGVDAIASATYEYSNGVADVYYPEFADINGGVADDLDADTRTQLFGQLHLGNLTLLGAYGRRARDVPTASYGTLFNEQQHRERTIDERSFVAGRYDRLFGDTRLDVRGSAQYYAYGGIYPYASENAAIPVLVLTDGAQGLFWSIDAHATRALPGRQTLTVGGELIDNAQQHQWFRYNDPELDDVSLRRSSTKGALYVQNEIKLRPWLLVNVGARYDRYPQFDRVSPRGAVIVSPSRSRSFKYLYGEAFRAPNAYELHYYPLTDPQLAPESITTHEVVWEEYYSDWLRTSMSAYRYRASQLITLESIDPSPEALERLGFLNRGLVHAQGLELEAEMRLKNGVQGRASYALQRAMDEALDAELTNSPRHMMNLRLSVPGPIRNSFASLELQGLSRRLTLSGASVAPHVVAHLTLSAPLGRGLELFGGVRNLFNHRYRDPGSHEHVQDAIEQNGRTVRIGVRWTFSAKPQSN